MVEKPTSFLSIKSMKYFRAINPSIHSVSGPGEISRVVKLSHGLNSWWCPSVKPFKFQLCNHKCFTFISSAARLDVYRHPRLCNTNGDLSFTPFIRVRPLLSQQTAAPSGTIQRPHFLKRGHWEAAIRQGRRMLEKKVKLRGLERIIKCHWIIECTPRRRGLAWRHWGNHYKENWQA